MSSPFRIVSALVLTAALLGFFTGNRASAGPISYHVTVDTSTISATSGALEFQYNSFAGDPPGNAVISNFAGGTPGSTFDKIGDVTGLLPGPVTIANTPGLNDLLQDFTYGSSFSFDVTLTGTGTFAMSLWDADTNTILSGGGNQLFPVNSSGAALLIDVTDSNSLSSPGVVTAAPQVTAQVIPEPSSVVLLGAAVTGLVCPWLLRRRTRNT